MTNRGFSARVRNRTTSPLRHRRLRRSGAVRILFLVPAIAILGVLSVYPVVLLIQMSVSRVGISNFLGIWPAVGFKNFTTLFSSVSFQQVGIQTLVFVASVLAGSMLGGLLVALLLQRSQGFSLVTQTTMILIWTLPPVIVGSLWKFLLATNGFVNSALLFLHVETQPTSFLAQPVTGLWAEAAVTIWIGVPFAALVIKSALLDVSQEILDAAKVDGASPLQIIYRIILPSIRPTLLILGVLIVVAAFKAFDIIYTMTRGGPGTTSATLPFLGYITAFQSYDFGSAAAIGVVTMIIVLALAIAYIFAVRIEER